VISCQMRYSMTVNLQKLFPVLLAMLLMPAFLGAADQIRIRDDAPAQYEVVRGDTLWDISGRFLEDPWLWPEVWELNPQIENPHLIYPGDVIELQYSANGPLLTLRRAGSDTNAGGLRTVKLSPRVRREPLDNAIPAIPLDRISSVLSENIVVPETELDAAPYLIGNRSGSLLSRDGDEVFAKGAWDTRVQQYDIIRPGRKYQDPETKKTYGVEGKMVGTATLVERNGDKATLLVTDSIEEGRAGDRFIPSAGNRIDSNYFPQPPKFNINGDILDIVANRTMGSVYDSIVINKGSNDNLKAGDLLALQKPEVIVEDTIEEVTLGERFRRAIGTDKGHLQTFNGEKYGTVLVYRVFENASLGIIMSADDIVRQEDKIVTP
jgi:hypothetical protein